jgi:hypothetical protein
LKCLIRIGRQAKTLRLFRTKMTRTRIKKEIVEVVLQRANGYCEVCGKVLNDYALHHRKLKSRGGKDSVVNLMVLHHECHNMGTYSVHMTPGESTKAGYMVSSWAEPEDVAVLQPDGSKVFYKENGDKEKA